MTSKLIANPACDEQGPVGVDCAPVLTIVLVAGVVVVAELVAVVVAIFLSGWARLLAERVQNNLRGLNDFFIGQNYLLLCPARHLHQL